MNAIHAHGNEGPLEIDAPEACRVRGSRIDVSLVLRGNNHEGNALIVIITNFFVGGDLRQDFLCFSQSTLTDEPPGVLGGEKERWDEYEGPEPSCYSD